MKKPQKSEDIKKQVEQELIEKSKKQQEAAQQINAILTENGLTLVVEQNIRIVPKQ